MNNDTRVRPTTTVQPPVAPRVNMLRALADRLPEPVAVEVYWEVSASTFRAVWCALFALYVFVLLYVSGLAGGYFALTYVAAFSYYVELFHLIPLRSFTIVMAFYSLLSLVYLARVAQFVYYSVRHGQLVFPASLPSTLSSTLSSTQGTKRHCGDDSTATTATTATTSRPLQRIQRLVCSTSGFLGVRGVYFESVVMVREVIEVAIQTSQAYVCSHQTAKFWVNATFAALIVVNCYSSPLLHRLGHAKTLSETGGSRAAVLVLDLALDVVWFAVIPIMLWLPYMKALVGTELALYRDTLIVEGIMELAAMVVTSYADLVLKLWPAASLYFAMKKIELLVRRRPHHRNAIVAQGSARSTVPSALSPVTVVSVAVVPKDSEMRARIERWLRLLLLCWGHAVLVVFIHANFVRSPACSPGCQLVLRPWLRASRDCDCAAFEIDCFALRISGAASEIERALTDANIAPRGLMNLILAHCPVLHVPPTVGALHDLYGLVVFNCSLVSWHADAWVTRARHPHLGRVQLIHTFVTDVPQAILHADLPPRLLEIAIVASNLSSLPDDVAVFWSHLNTLLLDHGHFQTYPSVLSRLPALQTLSLYNNQITHIPDDALADSRDLGFFHVARNPLRSLPASFATRPSLFDVFAMYTAVDDFVAPLARATGSVRTRVEVFGFASPGCDASNAQAHESDAPWLRCHDKFFTYDGTKTLSYYPLEAKLAEKRVG